ncbi:MAG: septum formation initiator family protein [bacterium]|nr:septum formation initiator family protein [bacterium]
MGPLKTGQTKSPWHFMRWPLIIAANILILLFVGISAGRETYRQWQVDQEIDGLKDQVSALEGKKLRLLDTIQQMNAPDVLDRDARLRLDLKKPGERVIVLRGLGAPGASAQEVGGQAPTVTEGSNAKKWFDYFFKHVSL